jgi:uncharacterized protein
MKHLFLTKKKKPTAITIVLTIGLVIAILLWVGASLFKESQTLNVQGSYSTKLSPDKVWMTLGVQTQDANAQYAEERNTEISNKIYSSLESLGLTSSDYKTESYYVNPTTNYYGKISGYSVVHTIRVDTDKIELASEILDAAVAAGANLIYGVNFDLSENTRENAKAEALKKATESAKAKAEGIASGLDMKITGVKSVSDSSINYYPYIYRDFAASEVTEKGAESIITEPGTVEVSASVSVVYKLG